MSACNGPPVVRTLSGMVAMAGEAEKEEVEDGKPKKVMILMILMGIRLMPSCLFSDALASLALMIVDN